MPAAVGPGATKLVCQHFVADPTVESYLVVADAEVNGPIVTMKFYDNDGKLIGEGKELVQPFGKLNLNAGKYVDKVANGTIHIEAQVGNITADYWQAEKAKSYQIATSVAGI